MDKLENLFSWANYNLLKVFFEYDGPFSFTALLKNSKMSRDALNKSLKTLQENDLIEQKLISKAKLYYAKDNILFKTLKKYYNYQTIYNKISSLKKDNLEIYLFGSYASGENKEDSDVDLLVICNNKQIVAEIDKKTKDLNKETQIIFKTLIEYAKMEKESPSFYSSINKTKIRLI